MLLIIVGSVYLMRPSEEEIKKEQLLQDSIANAKTANAAVTTSIAANDTTATNVLQQDSVAATGPFGNSKNGSETLTTLENDLIKVNISNKGGRIKSVELKGEKDYTGKPLIMFDGDDNTFGLQFSTAGENINTNDLYFNSPAQGFAVSKQDSSSVSFRLNYAEGKYIDYIYSLKGDSYQVGFVIVTKGIQDVVAPSQKTLILNWNAALSQKEKDLSNEQRYSSAYYQTSENDVEHLSVSKDDKEELGKVKWITFKQHFFSNTLIADQYFDGGSLAVNTVTDPNTVKSFEANMNLDF